MTKFFQRLVEAFGTDNSAEIARQLNLERQAVYRWRDGKNIPSIETLLLISEKTGTSLHWLITGQGPKFVPPLFAIGEHLLLPPSPAVPLKNSEKEIIETLAQTTNQTLDQVLRELLIEALEHRGLMKPRYSPAMLVLRPDIKLIAVPLIGSISAGQPIKYFKEHRNVMVAEIFLHDGYQHCVLEIVGDDVGWPNGDYVICCDNKHPESGSTVIAQIDGGPPTVKRIFFEGINIRLQPISNKSPGDLFLAEKVEIIYTVTGVQHNP